MDSISHLIQFGKQYDLDLINVISIGEGNYGKTPIFYAITQDRNDAVNLLLDYHPNLLIVNNKGQTPCSMAVTHLNMETCERMFAMEQQQLQQENKFVNYRKSHSDGQLYGDLDPRFPIDFDNWTNDLKTEFLGIYQIMDDTSFDHKNDIHYPVQPLELNIYTRRFSKPLPRSLRPTTPDMRRAKFQKTSINTKDMKRVLTSTPSKKNKSKTYHSKRICCGHNKP